MNGPNDHYDKNSSDYFLQKAENQEVQLPNKPRTNVINIKINLEELSRVYYYYNFCY